MKQIKIFILLIILIITSCSSINTNTVKADELSDNINDQLANIDLTELEYYFNG